MLAGAEHCVCVVEATAEMLGLGHFVQQFAMVFLFEMYDILYKYLPYF